MLEPRDLEMIAEIVAAAIKPLQDDITELKEDVAGLKEDVAEVKRDVAQLKLDVSELKLDVAKLNDRMDVQEKRMDNLEKRMDNLEKRMDNLEDRMDHLDNRVNTIGVTLENETNRGISIIAEGHRDLNRKLNEALKADEEKEMLLLRVNRLEGEVSKIKDKLEIA